MNSAIAIDMEMMGEVAERGRHLRPALQVAIGAAHLNAQLRTEGPEGHLPDLQVAIEQSLAACRVARTDDLETARAAVRRHLEDGNPGGAAAALIGIGAVCNGPDVQMRLCAFVTTVTKGRRRPFSQDWVTATPEQVAEAAEDLIRACWLALILINNELGERAPEVRQALEDMGG